MGKLQCIEKSDNDPPTNLFLHSLKTCSTSQKLLKSDNMLAEISDY